MSKSRMLQRMNNFINSVVSAEKNQRLVKNETRLQQRESEQIKQQLTEIIATATKALQQSLSSGDLSEDVIVARISIAEEDLKKILQTFFTERYQRIRGTELDYSQLPMYQANEYCLEMAKVLRKDNPYTILMPPVITPKELRALLLSEIKEEKSSQLLTLESIITIAELKRINNESSDADLPDALQKFFANRWERIRGTLLAYPQNPNAAANQLCLLIANNLAPGATNSLLMPTVQRLNDLSGDDDFNYPGLRFQDFILSDDDKYFINIEQCLESAEEHGKLISQNSDHGALDKTQTNQLSSAEQKRILQHSVQVREYYTAITETLKYKEDKDDPSFGTMISELAQRLREGGKQGHKGGTEEIAGPDAVQGIMEFKKFVDALSKEEQEDLFKVTAKDLTLGTTFGAIWYRLLYLVASTGLINLIPENINLKELKAEEIDKLREEEFKKLREKITAYSQNHTLQTDSIPCVELFEGNLTWILRANKQLFDKHANNSGKVKEAKLDILLNRQNEKRITLQKMKKIGSYVVEADYGHSGLTKLEENLYKKENIPSLILITKNEHDIVNYLSKLKNDQILFLEQLKDTLIININSFSISRMSEALISTATKEKFLELIHDELNKKDGRILNYYLVSALLGNSYKKPEEKLMLIEAIKLKLPSFVKNNLDFRNMLFHLKDSPSAGMLLIENLKDVMSEIFPNLEAFNQVFRVSDSNFGDEKQAALCLKFINFSNIIQSNYQLYELLNNHPGKEEIIFSSLGPKQTDFIKKDLAFWLNFPNPVVLKHYQKELGQELFSIENLKLHLKNLNPIGFKNLVTFFDQPLNDLVSNPTALLDCLKVISPEFRTDFLFYLKANLPNLITTSTELSNVLLQLPLRNHATFIMQLDAMHLQKLLSAEQPLNLPQFDILYKCLLPENKILLKKHAKINLTEAAEQKQDEFSALSSFLALIKPDTDLSIYLPQQPQLLNSINDFPKLYRFLVSLTEQEILAVLPILENKLKVMITKSQVSQIEFDQLVDWMTPQTASSFLNKIGDNLNNFIFNTQAWITYYRLVAYDPSVKVLKTKLHNFLEQRPANEFVAFLKNFEPDEMKPILTYLNPATIMSIIKDKNDLIIILNAIKNENRPFLLGKVNLTSILPSIRNMSELVSLLKLLPADELTLFQQSANVKELQRIILQDNKSLKSILTAIAVEYKNDDVSSRILQSITYKVFTNLSYQRHGLGYFDNRAMKKLANEINQGKALPEEKSMAPKINKN